MMYRSGKGFVRYRLVLVFLPIIVSAAAFMSLRSLCIATHFEEFIPQKHPYTLIHHELESIFGGLNHVSLVIQAKKGTIFQSDILQHVFTATEHLYLLEGVNIASIEGIAARKTRRVEPGPNGFSVRRLMAKPQLSEEEIRELKNYVRGNPLFEGVLISKDKRATLIQADFFPEVPSQAIFNEIKNLADSITHTDIEVYYAGKPILEGWLDYYLPQMGSIFAISAGCIGLLLYVSFRNVWAVVIPCGVSMMAALWGLAGIFLLGFTLTPSTVLVPFLVFALGICHSVQFMKRYSDRVQCGADNTTVAQDVFHDLAKPASISLLTDGVGFLSLMFIPLGIMQKMALAAVIGLGSLFYCVVFFIPALLSYLPPSVFIRSRAEKYRSPVERLLPALATVIVSHHRLVMVLFAGVFLIGLGGVRKLTIGDDGSGSSVLSADAHYNRSERVITELFNGAHPFYVLVRGNVEEALINAQVLCDMESLQEYILKKVPEAGRARSLVEYIKGFNMVFNGFDPAFFKIPDQDATIGEYLFLYSIAGYPGDFDFLCDRDFKNANIKIDLRDSSQETVYAVMRAISEWSAAHRQSRNVKFLYPGGAAGLQTAVQETLRLQIPLTIFAVGVMLFLCVLMYMRDMTMTLMLMLPLFVSITITYGIMGYLQIPITIETLPLASLGMGLGIDYGIYIAARLKKKDLTKQVVVESLATSGKAVVFGAAAVSLSVLLWIFSPVSMEARLGKCLSLLLFVNMVSAIIFLPALFVEKNQRQFKVLKVK